MKQTYRSNESAFSAYIDNEIELLNYEIRAHNLPENLEMGTAGALGIVELPPGDDSYIVRRDETTVTVAGATRRATLHGALNVIERFRLGHSPEEVVGVYTPSISVRSVSANFLYPDQVGPMFLRLAQLGANELVLLPCDYSARSYRNYQTGGKLEGTYGDNNSFPFGTKALPEFRRFLDAKEVDRQTRILNEACRHAEQTGIKLTFCITIPKFPLNDIDIVRQLHPEFLTQSGEFDPGSEAYRVFLGSQLEEILECHPQIGGFEFWLAEGAGAVIFGYETEQLETVGDYLPGWLETIDRVSRRHGVSITLFTHHYSHTAETRTRLYDLISEYPEIAVMEDITWPEEHLFLETLAFLQHGVRRKFLRHPNSRLLFLLDTEYMGQGILPSVLPFWYKKHVDYCRANGVSGGSGRVHWWDGFETLNNYNASNLYFFLRMAWDDSLSPAEALTDYLALRYGTVAGTALVPVFSMCESLVRGTMSVKGIGVFNHSAFPVGWCINNDMHLDPSDHPYYQVVPMKSLVDLFQEGGTPLFGATPNLSAVEQWREQQKLTAPTLEELTNERDDAVARARDALQKIDDVRHLLRPREYQKLREDFGQFLVLSLAMRDFVLLGYHTARGEVRECHKHVDSLEAIANEVLAHHGQEYYFRLPDVLMDLVSWYRQSYAAIQNGSPR